MSKKDDYWVNQSKSFDLSADYYDQFRPSYPQEMVDDIVQITGINNNSKLLEIGAGSGKATELFVDKGFNITCVEPGANLVKIGEEKFKKTGQVKYITSRFEDLTLPKNAYDFIFSAQAFHWVPKPLGYEKCYHPLKERHYLALYWNYYLFKRSETRRGITPVIFRVYFSLL